MNGMKYKGYYARIDFDPQNKIFVGRVVGINDVVCFHGKTVPELEAAFADSINDYLSACEKLGQKPNKTYSGNLMLRIPADIHAAVATAAEINGQSINQWVARVLEAAVHAH